MKKQCLIKRNFIYAHYDATGLIPEYVLFCLGNIRPLSARTIFVTTAALQSKEKEKLDSVVDDVIEIENIGYDFYSWKTGFMSFMEKSEEIDELILLNSSILGPIFPLSEAFNKMERSSCDFWGMTESFEENYHLQSYFLCFRKKMIYSELFKRYWIDMAPLADRQEVINRYELKLTRYFREHGFKSGSLIKSMDIRLLCLKNLSLIFKKKKNPTLYYPDQLLQLRMPFAKIQLLRDNPFNLQLNEIYERHQDVMQWYVCLKKSIYR